MFSSGPQLQSDRDAAAAEVTPDTSFDAFCLRSQLLKILAKEGKLVQLYEQAKERSEKLNQARKKQKTK